MTAKLLRGTHSSQAALLGWALKKHLTITHLLQTAPTGLLDELLWVHLLANIITHVDGRCLEKLGRKRQESVTACAVPARLTATRDGFGASRAVPSTFRLLPTCPALTFMYLLKMPWISSLMLGCSTARSRSMDTLGSVKLRVEGSGGRVEGSDPLPGPV